MQKIIEGKLQNAICFTEHIESSAYEQIQRMISYPIGGEHIRIMPDVHSGKGCTIGTTMLISDKVVPNLVGVDIGCGMYVLKLCTRITDFAKLDEVVHGIPSGRNVWEMPQEKFDIDELKCFNKLKKLSWLECSLGTLGGGNHFIEIDVDDEAEYLVIHTGSRNLGKQVAEIYQTIAIRDDRAKIIAECKAKGLEKEIEARLQAAPVIPRDLAYLEGNDLQDYIHDIVICQKFAKRNREKIAEIILAKMGLQVQECFQTIHNYIDIDNMILRKGAISAQKGEKVLIPMNMQYGSIIAIGKGNPEWNYSAPHGAGRLLSRSQARKTLELAEYEERMKDIYTTSANMDTIDEAPMAYKPAEWILDDIKDTVEIQSVIKPVYNFKAVE